MVHSDTLQLIQQPDPPAPPIASWSFSIIDFLPPFLRNRNPDADSVGNEDNTNISVDILYGGSATINLSTLDAYVDGVVAYSGLTDSFQNNFDGPSSAITQTTVDGYDGYHLVLDSTVDFLTSALKSVRISVRDTNGNHLDETYYFRIGISASVTASPYEITLDVVFSGDMSIGPALRKTSNYQFDNGMYARLVDVISARQVRLWVELFHSTSPFTLTFSDEIIDAYGGGLVASSNPVTIVPFYSTADLTNFNGRVRTWRQSNIVRADSQRIYLAGIRGIDVFRKQTEATPVRWGQVFDAYGINAMFVANFGGDLVISDTAPPFLTGQSPTPGGSMSAAGPISFTIQDTTTAVEITSTTVYINDALAFSGGINGWANGYYGAIAVGHKTLSFEIYSADSFPAGEGSIRIIATDLMGNSLDETYTFSIAATLGFGAGGFGLFGFGGV